MENEPGFGWEGTEEDRRKDADLRRLTEQEEQEQKEFAETEAENARFHREEEAKLAAQKAEETENTTP